MGGRRAVRVRGVVRARSGGEVYATAAVRRGSLVLTATGNGSVGAGTSEGLFADVSGTVTRVLVAEAEKVGEGAVLVELHSDDVELREREARLELENARLNLEELLDPDPAEVEAARLKVEQAQLSLAQREDEVAKLVVRSPATGTVLSTEVNPGDDVRAGDPLLSMFDESSLALKILVGQCQISSIGVGQEASVGSDVLETPVAGRVSSIAPEGTVSERAVVFEVMIELRELGGLRPGMTADATIFPSSVYASGNVEARVKHTITAKVGGTVLKVNAQEGDRVAAGDVLVVLDNTDLDLGVR